MIRNIFGNVCLSMKYVSRKIDLNKIAYLKRNCSSITYSGGQAISGQGGFYGSGGSRVLKDGTTTHHPEAIAKAVDIEKLSSIMEEVEFIQNELHEQGDTLSSKTLELKSKLKKTICTPAVNEILKRLEVKGEPVWGLSVKERDLVRHAKELYMSS